GSSGPVTFQAKLDIASPGGVAGATINFTVDGNAAGSATTNNGGVAQFTTYNPSALTAGVHNVQASFTAATIGGVAYGGSTSGTLPLTVVSPPTISKAFGAATIAQTGTTSLTFTLNNSNAVALTGVAFTDSLPSGLVVADTPAAVNNCGGTFTA